MVYGFGTRLQSRRLLSSRSDLGTKAIWVTLGPVTLSQLNPPQRGCYGGENRRGKGVLCMFAAVFLKIIKEK